MQHPDHFLKRFLRGVDKRVGINSRLDQAISIELIKLLMAKMEVEVKGEV